MSSMLNSLAVMLICLKLAFFLGGAAAPSGLPAFHGASCMHQSAAKGHPTMPRALPLRQ